MPPHVFALVSTAIAFAVNVTVPTAALYVSANSRTRQISRCNEIFTLHSNLPQTWMVERAYLERSMRVEFARVLFHLPTSVSHLRKRRHALILIFLALNVPITVLNLVVTVRDHAPWLVAIVIVNGIVGVVAGVAGWRSATKADDGLQGVVDMLTAWSKPDLSSADDDVSSGC